MVHAQMEMQPVTSETNSTTRVVTERYSDWPVRLNAYILEAQKDQFKMGTHDCCTFAAGAVEAMTGVDPMPEFRGKYDGWRSSAKALKKLGAGTTSLYDTLCAKFGPPLAGVYGQKGDIVMYEDACGVMLGRMGLFIGENGFVYVRIRHLSHTFRIS